MDLLKNINFAGPKEGKKEFMNAFIWLIFPSFTFHYLLINQIKFMQFAQLHKSAFFGLSYGIMMEMNLCHCHYIKDLGTTFFLNSSIYQSKIYHLKIFKMKIPEKCSTCSAGKGAKVSAFGR